jgi:hypothetical protein
VIAEALSTQRVDGFDQYAVRVAHISVIINAWGKGHPSFAAIHAYLSWPLILRAWQYIFSINFSGAIFLTDWKMPPSNYLESHLSLVAYARQGDDMMTRTNEHLMVLVEHVCHIFDKEKQQRERGEDRSMQGKKASVRQERRALAEQIQGFLGSSQRAV